MYHRFLCGLVWSLQASGSYFKGLAILYKNDIVVYKVNVDKEKELAAAFGIQSIPTFLFIPKEGQPQISMGALPREEFVKQIDTFLLKKK